MAGDPHSGLGRKPPAWTSFCCTAPTISNLHFSPSSAPLGSGDVQGTGSINLSDPDGDVVRVRITEADTEDFLDVQWWAYA